MNLLTVCIPTYKRSRTVGRTIESVAQQIEKYDLAEQVGIYVADDASPDDTREVIERFREKPYIELVSRTQNLGMSKNIRKMLAATEGRARYLLIITDDDYLQPDVLLYVVRYLRGCEGEQTPAGLVWTPRYSYTEDGELHCIECAPFDEDRYIAPSAGHAASYMRNGFILSGLIIRGGTIDYAAWDAAIENAFFPVIVTGNILRRYAARYWNKNLVHHTVLNECHWERWGKNDAEITLRLFVDFVNAYAVVGRAIERQRDRLLFYALATKAVVLSVKSLSMDSGFSRLSNEDVRGLVGGEAVAFSQIERPIQRLYRIAKSTVVAVYWIKRLVFATLARLSGRKASAAYRGRAMAYQKALGNMEVISKWQKRQSISVAD